MDTSVSRRISWKSIRASLELGCQIAQVVTVDVDRWSMAWAATTVVPAGEFSPVRSSPFLRLVLSFLVLFLNERQRVAESCLLFPHPFILESSHWHVVLLVLHRRSLSSIRTLANFICPAFSHRSSFRSFHLRHRREEADPFSVRVSHSQSDCPVP